MKLIFSLVTIFLAAINISFAQENGVLRGSVSDAFSNEKIEKARVEVIGKDLRTETNAKGEFEFTQLPLGRIELQISSVGHGTQIIKEILIKAGKTNQLDIYLESEVRQLEEVKVTAASPNLSGAVTSLQSISMEQVMRLPATFYDPARLAFTFPGVANTNDQANGMSIRGNNPNGLQWRLEGLEIVNPNHLANAGTFSDQPAANAGGTNMLSGQMLGNMNFLTGAFPAEYGNALSGVMDMRLRKGNNKEYEHTVQAGLIGVDLSSEGPLSKKNGSSYLINYRYSFTGLLALGGLSFGGETIKFQDLAVNLSFPTKKAGEFSVFAMGGLNSNEFAFDDEDGLGPQEEKDLSVIDYYGKMVAFGGTHQKAFKNNLLWKSALVYSTSSVEREQYIPNNGGFQDFDINEILTYTSSIQKKISTNNSLKAGLFLTRNFLDNSSLNVINNERAIVSNTIQPYFTYTQGLGDKASLVLGLHNVNYLPGGSVYDSYSTLEPRLSFAYQISKNLGLNAAYGKHSQLSNLRGLEFITPLKSDQFVLNLANTLNNLSKIKAEAFYQINTSTLFSSTTGSSFFTETNLNDLFEFSSARDFLGNSFTATDGRARNYGVELSYQRYLDKGLFALVNTTLYKSEFEAADGNYYDTKYSGDFIFNFTIGKEWTTKKDNIIGANTRIVWMGGFRNYVIDVAQSKTKGTTIFDYSQPLLDRNPDYFRPDIRVYFRKNKGKKNIMWSLDIQNLANYQNVSYKYYDSFLGEVKTKYQLGMIPMLNYRIEF
ncbi:TonB-dependent Receptor Plug Domain [Spirosomataceae bacterium TFI 002]|nr:TonB-dependent Receptor Plug Domain [Spirosomataceae bacterium TFI 002]